MSSNPVALGVTRTRPVRSGIYLGMSLLSALIVAVGFAPSFYLRPLSDQPPLSVLVQVHGFVFTAWIVLFAAQSLLIRQRRLALHRTLGVLGGVIAAAMIYTATVVALAQAASRYAASRTIVGFPPLVFLAVQFGDLVQFGIFVVLGVALRRRPEAHKRLMLLATLTIIAPAIGRMAVPLPVKFWLPLVIVVACMAWELLRRRRVHPAFLWGGLGFIAATPLRVIIGESAPWQALARWMVT